jgi:hypothetical protein
VSCPHQELLKGGTLCSFPHRPSNGAVPVAALDTSLQLAGLLHSIWSPISASTPQKELSDTVVLGVTGPCLVS